MLPFRLRYQSDHESPSRSPHQKRLRLLYLLLPLLTISLLVFARPIMALYGYVPFIYSTSPTPPKSYRLDKRSSIRPECRAAWISGYYATSLSWDDVVAFYTNYGFAPDADGDTLRSYEGQFIRGRFVRAIGPFRDPRDWEGVNDPTVRSAIQAAITGRQTVYFFFLHYEEDKDIYRHSPCWHD